VIPTHQAKASQPELPMGVPTSQACIASITCVRGWFSAKSRNTAGIVSVGTNALLTNVNGKMMMKPDLEDLVEVSSNMFDAALSQYPRIAECPKDL